MNNKLKKKQKLYPSLEQGQADCFIADETADYGTTTPFATYFQNQEPYVKLLKGDCIEILNKARENSVDMIFADPPYFLSNGGITCHAGKMVSVNKGKWDKSKGAVENHNFTLRWLAACQRILKPNGTIWVSGTTHIIYSIGYAMQELGYKILNDIIWHKRNPPPNLSCRYFTHSTEIVLWAAKNEKSRHYFNYDLMKSINHGKQMKNVWEINAPRSDEKGFGKHPTQKPIALLKRLLLASTQESDLVIDPFSGSSTTGVAAVMLGRKFVGIDLEDEYLELSKKRLTSAISSCVSDLYHSNQLPTHRPLVASGAE
ncbi:MAG: site-specific DNA-methyltransferase [Nitrospinae bacterium]|nr:site-specific DNA-methyltransferase [Nitrospinota bacterium]